MFIWINGFKYVALEFKKTKTKERWIFFEIKKMKIKFVDFSAIIVPRSSAVLSCFRLESKKHKKTYTKFECILRMQIDEKIITEHIDVKNELLWALTNANSKILSMIWWYWRVSIAKPKKWVIWMSQWATKIYLWNCVCVIWM